MSVEVQLQMRRNIEQVNEAVSDLGDWLSDVNKRDATLRGVAPTGSAGGGADGDATDEEEEAREIEAAKEELRRLSAQQDGETTNADGGGSASAGATSAAAAAGGAASKKPAKGAQTHAQKYGQWERYDVDAVVGRMEEHEADQERLRKEVTRLENARAQAKARKAAAAAAAAADALKAQGNAAFGAARYEEAVGLYTDALGHTPRSAVLYANRALALLKLGAHAEAEEDCGASLLIDRGFVKALLRRAQARHALEKYDGALEDLEDALEREPRNGAARQLMADCRRLKAARQPKPRPKLTRVKVEVVEHDVDNDGDEFVAAVTAADVPASTGGADGGGASRGGVAPAPTASGAAEGVAIAASPTANESGAAAASSDAPASPAAPSPSSSSSSAAVAAVARAAASPAAPTAASFAVPTTLADMERAWRSLRNHPAEFAALLRRLEPDALGRLFKHNLPAELLSAILGAIDQHYTFPDDAPAALATLRVLPASGRFTILVMCLDKKDGAAVASVFGKLGAAAAAGALPADADLAKLRTQYE